jgi:hypothetical protein
MAAVPASSRPAGIGLAIGNGYVVAVFNVPVPVPSARHG